MSNTGGAVGISAGSTDLTDSTIESIAKDSRSGSSDPGVVIEKGEVTDDLGLLLPHDEQFPEDPDGEIETQQFTFRAVFVGCILGAVIAASKYGLHCSFEPYQRIN